MSESTPAKIYFADFNIPRDNANYYARTGRLNRIASGVYVSSKLSEAAVREAVREHAARIAANRFGVHPLIGGAAYHRGSVDDCVWLASDYRRRPIEIGGIEFKFVHIDAPLGLPHESASVVDSIGEFKVQVVPDELNILIAFSARRGSTTETEPGSLTATEISAIYQRGALRGGPEAMLKRLKVFAERFGLMPEYDRAVKTFSLFSSPTRENRLIADYDVFFMGKRVANMTNDGRVWNYDPQPGYAPISLSKRMISGTSVPYFIDSIFPEVGDIRQADGAETDFRTLKNADRYVSNIIIRPKDAEAPIIVDTLECDLSDWMTDKTEFIGTTEGLPDDPNDDLYREIRIMNQAPDCPRLSGVQLKMPVNLSPSGVISPANGKRFTHILKLPGMDGRITLGSIEWYSMKLAAAAGVETENFGILNVKGLGPALIAERFDIPVSTNSREVVMGEDFCSVMGVSRAEKYGHDMTRVAETLMLHSTSPEEDGEQLLRSTIVSWVIGNIDSHLKNLMVIKRLSRDMSTVESIRLSPAYDLICGMIYMAQVDAGLPIGGQTMYSSKEFHILATSLNIKPQQCNEIINDVLDRIEEGVTVTTGALPSVILDHNIMTDKGMQNMSLRHIEKMNQIIMSRSASLRSEISNRKYRKTAISFG